MPLVCYRMVYYRMLKCTMSHLQNILEILNTTRICIYGICSSYVDDVWNLCAVFMGFDSRWLSGVDFLWSIPSCSAIRYLFFLGAGIIPNSINKNYENTDRVLSSTIYQYLMYMYKYITVLCRLNLRQKTC